MNAPNTKKQAARPYLDAETAGDLMTPNPLSIRDNATIGEAINFLTDKGYSAAPVIDECGKPVGVLSRSDILVHGRETVKHLCDVHAFYGDPFLPVRESSVDAFADLDTDDTIVRDVMTPVVFSAYPDTPALKAVEQMVELRVHRLFVVDKSGTLVGVISAMDVLRRLTL